MPFRKNKSMKKQKGGVAPSCVSGVDVSRYTCGGGANIHNNPQGSKDLDAAFTKASGMKGGGAKHPSGCGCTGSSTDFKGYLNEVKRQLGQSGGGVSTMVEDMIAGQPVYKSYDDCCPPSLVGGKLKFGAPGKSTCGSGMRGGAKKSRKSSKSRRSSKSSKSSKSNKRSQSRRSSKSKGRAHKMNKSRKQKGGHYKNSKPSHYPKAHETTKSHFGEVTEKDFSQRQPFFNEMSI
jgi:hypothetical protein